MDALPRLLIVASVPGAASQMAARRAVLVRLDTVMLDDGRAPKGVIRRDIRSDSLQVADAADCEPPQWGQRPATK